MRQGKKTANKSTLTKTVGAVAIVTVFLLALAFEPKAWERGAGGVWVAVMGSRQTVVCNYGNKTNIRR